MAIENYEGGVNNPLGDKELKMQNLEDLKIKYLETPSAEIQAQIEKLEEELGILEVAEEL